MKNAPCSVIAGNSELDQNAYEQIHRFVLATLVGLVRLA
jgi:hypothetical protein